ncbi:MAG: methyltransferase [Bacteroidota bacterium]
MSITGRDILKPLLKRVVPRFYRWYLRKERSHNYQGIEIKVPPGVFHPGLFFSTHLMLKHLEQLAMEERSVLEIGAGSGLVSIWCARKGAKVTATDISDVALAAMAKNAEANATELTIVKSDLFQELPAFRYDYVTINPPYYKGLPENEEQFAWYAGPHYEYFHVLFADLKDYRHPESRVLMVVSEDCDLKLIKDIARLEHWSMEVVNTGRSWGEWLFVYELRYLRAE